MYGVYSYLVSPPLTDWWVVYLEFVKSFPRRFVVMYCSTVGYVSRFSILNKKANCVLLADYFKFEHASAPKSARRERSVAAHTVRPLPYFTPHHHARDAQGETRTSAACDNLAYGRYLGGFRQAAASPGGKSNNRTASSCRIKTLNFSTV
jgi:hypothetical protein